MRYFENCEKVLENIPDKSINLFLEDLPYNITKLHWEYEVCLENYWKLRIPKLADKGVFVLTGNQPFTSKLVMSNLSMFKVEWIWQKTMGTNFLNVKRMPYKKHENILVFANNGYTYNPQMEKGLPYIKKAGNGKRKKNAVLSGELARQDIVNNGTRYPSTVQLFPNRNRKNIHPTQKPLELWEYLIKTYSNENDIVFDGYSGSGTTAIACINTNRKYIICENDEKYYELQTKRIQNHEKFFKPQL